MQWVISQFPKYSTSKPRGLAGLWRNLILVPPLLTFLFAILVGFASFEIPRARLLEREHVTATATITSLNRTKSSWTSRYNFSDATGRTYWGENRGERAYQPGLRVTVFYNPVRPAINALDLTDATRILQRLHVLYPVLAVLFVLGPMTLVLMAFVWLIARRRKSPAVIEEDTGHDRRHERRQ